jgi:hypothetical protein
MPRGRPRKNIATKNLIDKSIVGVRKKRTKSIVPSIVKRPMEELTTQEREEREKWLDSFLPKIDPNKKTVVLDLNKNAEACKEHTKGACVRPDIYLDYGCNHCSLFQNCACRLKKVKKNY